MYRRVATAQLPETQVTCFSRYYFRWGGRVIFGAGEKTQARRVEDGVGVADSGPVAGVVRRASSVSRRCIRQIRVLRMV